MDNNTKPYVPPNLEKEPKLVQVGERLYFG